MYNYCIIKYYYDIINTLLCVRRTLFVIDQLLMDTVYSYIIMYKYCIIMIIMYKAYNVCNRSHTHGYCVLLYNYCIIIPCCLVAQSKVGSRMATWKL